MQDQIGKLIVDERFSVVSDILIGAVSLAYPIIGLGALATKSITRLIISRSDAYKANISEDIIDNLEILIQESEFAQKLSLTFYAAVKAHSDQKSELFAKMLNGTYQNDFMCDELFEYTELVNRLSFRDIELLSVLEKMPRGENITEEDYRPIYNEWIDSITYRFDMSKDMLNSIYLKLQGMGLCKKWSHSAFLGQLFCDFWELTDYYYKFTYIVKNKN
jgi:hypothetical protein